MSLNRPLTQVQPYWNNSAAIRQEIQRFESVHPSIYAIYDLIESIPDPVLGQQIRDHVVCIEGKEPVAAKLENSNSETHFGQSPANPFACGESLKCRYFLRFSMAGPKGPKCFIVLA